MNKKESFTNSKESFTNNNEGITESIKNLGSMAKRIQEANGDFTFPANLNITGRLNLLPHGTIVMWAHGTPPTGWWECNGQHVSGYGHVPDLRGRFVLGSGTPNNTNRWHDEGHTAGYPHWWSRRPGETGGEWRHQLSEGEMPSHTHELKRPMYRGWYEGSGEEIITHEGGWVHDFNMDTWNGGDAGGRKFKIKINPKGNNYAHNNMPPYYALMYIIKIY